MSIMQTEVYQAFRSIGIDEDVAAKAAAALNERDKDITAIKSDVSLLKWMVGTNVTLTLLVLGKLFLIPG